MKFENIINAIRNIIDHQPNIILDTIQETIDYFGTEVHKFSPRITVLENSFIAGIRSSYNTSPINSFLSSHHIHELELYCEYNAAEIFVKFEEKCNCKGLDPESLYKSYKHFYGDYYEDVVKKLYENGNIAVVLVSYLGYDFNLLENRYKYGCLSNDYYVVNKRGE